MTDSGVAEAMYAANVLRAQGYRFDVAYSSRLQRAITTLDIMLHVMHQADLPRYQDWRLNERHYGALQGTDKAQAIAQAGEQHVWRWRRGYEDLAAPLSRSDPAHPIHDKRYADVDPARLPDVENLAQTRARVAQFWQEQIVPRIKRGERILISAHGNTLRALLMELTNMNVAEVESFEIPTGTPIVYDFDSMGRPQGWRYLEQTADPAKSA